MRRTARARTIQGMLAFSMLLGMGGGCVVIYSFEDFEKEAPRPCKTTADCPMASECGQYVCEGEICKVSNPVAAGKLTASNKRGDCLRLTCDGRGNVVAELDAKDVPHDGNDCTIDTCASGIPTNEQAPVGTPCGTDPKVTCNMAGACTGCSIDPNCGENTECTTWACENTICVKKIKPIGTVIDNAIPGDCREIVCNRLGELEEAIVTGDAPSDGNECTTDACTIDGKAEHEPASVDTPCGTCGICTTAGSCEGCVNTGNFDCYEGKCIPKPQPCTDGSTCPSTYCVDGFCCDQECSSTCMACINDKTGIPSGLCARITDGTDPDSECNNPVDDTCFEGQCRCENAKNDMGESGVDCGGTCEACTGKWSCGGATSCGGAGAATPCCNYPGCFDCVDQSGECQAIDGQTCALGAAPKKLSFGLVFQAGCLSLTGCKTVTCNCIP